MKRPVSPTVRLATGDSAGAPGLFRVDAETALFGSEDATPGSHSCVRVCAPLGRVGWAGLFGAFWCASQLPVAGLGALFVGSAPSELGFALPVVVAAFFFFCAPRLSLAFRVFRPGVPWASAACGPPPLFFFFFFLPPPPSAFFFSSAFLLFFLFGGFFFRFLSFLFLLYCAGCAVLGRFECPGLWGVFACVVLGVVLRQGLFCACIVSFRAPCLCLLSVCCCLLCCL